MKIRTFFLSAALVLLLAGMALAAGSVVEFQQIPAEITGRFPFAPGYRLSDGYRAADIYTFKLRYDGASAAEIGGRYAGLYAGYEDFRDFTSPQKIRSIMVKKEGYSLSVMIEEGKGFTQASFLISPVGGMKK